MPPPIDPTTAPMEARPVTELPKGAEWRFEPKWDGFRCLAFRDGQDIDLRSKSGQTLARYFPDVVAALAALPSRRFALDGEIVIPVERRLSFEALQLRLHPAESRVRKLATEHPAVFIAFDLLEAADGAVLLDRSFTERRRALEAFMAAQGEHAGLRLSPVTADRDA